MKKLFLVLSFFVSLFAKAQLVYRPSNSGYFITTNKPLGISIASPTDGRTYKADTINGLLRPYNGITEVKSYLPLGSQYRVGQFPIVVNSGGSLQSNGTFIGGSIQVWWFLKGQADSNLVRMDSTSFGGCVGCLLAANNLSDLISVSTALTNLGVGSMALLGSTASGNLSGTWPNITVADFNNQPPSYYLNFNNLTNKPTIPAQFNPIQGPGMAITGTYPNITFSSGGGSACINCNADTIGNIPLNFTSFCNNCVLTLDSTLGYGFWAPVTTIPILPPNIGSGIRVYSPQVPGFRSFICASGCTLDSTTNTNAVTLTVTSSGAGTVTSFSAPSGLSALFTTSVATATTTPVLTFTQTNAPANTAYGNFTGSSTQPSFGKVPVGAFANNSDDVLFGTSNIGAPTTIIAGPGLQILAGVISDTSSIPTFQQTLTAGRTLDNSDSVLENNFSLYLKGGKTKADSVYIGISTTYPTTAFINGIGDSKMFGFGASDTTKRFLNLIGGMINLPTINNGVSGETLVSDSTAIFSQMHTYVPGAKQVIELGLNDIILGQDSNVFRIFYLRVLDTLHFKWGFPYNQITLVGPDCYQNVCALQSIIAAWGFLINNVANIKGTHFYNIYQSILARQQGALGVYTIEDEHGMNDWHYILARALSRIMQDPITFHGQALAVNGVTELQSLRLSSVDSARANDVPLAYSPNGFIHRFANNSIPIFYPAQPQVGNLNLVANTQNYQLKLGGMFLQGYDSAGANCWVGENTYLSSGGFLYNSLGGAALVRFLNGNIALQTAVSGSAGTSVSLTTPLEAFTSGNVLVNGNASDVGHGVLAALNSAGNQLSLENTGGYVGFFSTSTGQLDINPSSIGVAIGKGLTNPSAVLELAAGTATAGTAPLKIDAGTNLTIPENGAVEYNGTHYYGTVGSTRYQLDQQTSPAAKNDLTAQSAAVATVTSYAVPGSGSFNTFRVGGYVTVTAISVSTVQLQVTWTDETSTSRTQSFFVQGTTSAISATGANGYSPIDIRVKQGTTITVSTAMTGVSATYDVGATITQLY